MKCKKVLAALLAFALCFQAAPLSVLAEETSTEIEGITCTLDDVNGTLTLSSQAGGAVLSEKIAENGNFPLSGYTEIIIGQGITGIGAGAFEGISGNAAIKLVTIGDSVTSIGERAFKDNSVLEEVFLGANVAMVGDGAFAECGSLKKVTLGADFAAANSVSSIFEGDSSLASLVLDGENNNYAVQDNVLFNKDKTTLIFYPQGKETSSYTVPDSVKTVGDEAFKDNGYLESVTLGGNTEIIGQSAFWNMPKLKNVTVYNKNTQFADSVFNGTGFTIYGYRGSTAQSYAERLGVTFKPLDASVDPDPVVLAGDISLDGKITNVDLILLVRHLVSLETLTDSTQKKAADVNEDGAVDTRDLVKLYRIILGFK